MGALITKIDKNSPASDRNVQVGDALIRINGHKIKDVLDFKFYSYDAHLRLELHRANRTIKLIQITKTAGSDLGLTFEPYLMDEPRACTNGCIFCFVDQLPSGMRDTLYFKDDDVRLSFLQGNYVTLTNLSEAEIRRIIDLRLSPLNISVHATDPELHGILLRTKKSNQVLAAIERLSSAGIAMNAQIVCCPGLNDKKQLERTMCDLAAMAPAVQSVSIVPVGLTRFRAGLYPLEPFDQPAAYQTIRQVEQFGEECLEKFGTRLFFSADELYLKAGVDIPTDEFYESYPQLENGVGMLRLLMEQSRQALEKHQELREIPFSIATGAAAADCLQKILLSAQKNCANIKGNVCIVRNTYFGETIDVAGLVTGGDLIEQLRGKHLGKRLLITKNMLRHGQAVFLDDVTLEDASRILGLEIRVIEQDGADLISAMYGY